jgi:uncharacterized protein YbbC (DUF1343 family)
MKQLLVLLVIVAGCSLHAQRSTAEKTVSPQARIMPGAERLDQYLPMIRGKKIGVFANQTSMVGRTHLVDTLKKLGIDIKVIFGPEHGFRGTADAGEQVGNYIDQKSGIPVVSLYGSKRRPSADDLKDIDVLVYDIQDVGVRFYTYISSLQEYMEAALVANIPLLVLDRPNPNGFYVDGPVLETSFRSFVGMQPIPVVYGMTIGEYAQMILLENWLGDEANAAFRRVMASRYTAGARYFHLDVIPCDNYTHKSRYVLPVAPSPNLPGIQSVYWYPSTCYFEGTVLSEGRGTDKPFQVFGHPSLPKNLYSFTPVSKPGATDPKLKGQVCYGWNVSTGQASQKDGNRIQLSYLIEAYRLFPDKDNFFIKPKKDNPKAQDWSFNRLAGNADLMQQLKDGKTEAEIRKSWGPRIADFKVIRKKYLLYSDFE